MDSEPVIRVEGLGKRYTLGASQKNGGYTALRDVLAEKAKSLIQRPFSRLSSRRPQSAENDFWALKDVSFEVKRGEVLGIIGRNGAGKSTLLKILSRITEPTEGSIRLRGRVASLLEVGTGFHPELTGRENIFLNGAILGMARAEIKAKFDEIVAFAEVERFLDTPVKRYSSGMYVRLAFAVAAHLEPEILIVDEVLAVGDAEFQKKCLNKMKDVSNQDGRTVLFVSHNMSAVRSLCETGILMKQGGLQCHLTIQETIAAYADAVETSLTVELPVHEDRPCITSVVMHEDDLRKGNLIVDISFVSPFPLNPPAAGIVIASTFGTPIFGSNPRFHGDGYDCSKKAEGTVRVSMNQFPIFPGTYTLSVWLGDWQTNYDEKRDLLTFEFRNGERTALTPNPEVIGYLNAAAEWRWLGT